MRQNRFPTDPTPEHMFPLHAPWSPNPLLVCAPAGQATTKTSDQPCPPPRLEGGCSVRAMAATLVEDSAAGHLGDNDLHPGRIGAAATTGFRKARKEALKVVICHRAIQTFLAGLCILPAFWSQCHFVGCGPSAHTPPQVHHLLHRWAKDDL